MGILLPAALALLALAIPIIIFYMLRLRREELNVSSELLWRRALQDRTANAPWQRLRRNLLLILQLLLLLLLVLALARPFFYTQAVAAGNLVVVLDASASMQATDEDSGASRFERARREADGLIDGLQGEERMAVVWAGPAASIAASTTGNKTALHDALRGLQSSNGVGDVQSALTLAAASARQLGDATVVLISDGALATVSGQQTGALPRMPSKARYINVGKSAGNVGITSMSLRDSTGGPQLFAGLYNSGSQPVRAILSIKVDGTLRDSRSVDLAAGGDGTVTLGGLPLGTSLVEASVSVEPKSADLLAADSTARVVRPKAPSSNVLLVTEGNSFLEKALNLLPGVKLFKVAAGGYTPSEGFGLTVLDGAMPKQIPPGNLLIFAPPNSALIPVSGTIQYPQVGQVAVNDPLLRFVDLSQTHIGSAQRIITPPWARVLARTSGGDPLVIAGETGGRRVVALAFDVHQSDLPLQVAFPILITNLVDWLQPSTSVDAPATLGAGDPISIRPMPDADQIVVTSPSGNRTALQPSGEQVSFAGTDELGLYNVQQSAKGKPLGEPEHFAVNLFNGEESNITPRPDIAFAGSEASTPSTGPAQRPEEIWPWVLALSLAILSIEWWLYNRAGRVRLPFRVRRL
jgi:hypothetical protein